MSDYATNTLATAVWSNGTRTLTNYGNDITAADVWNTLTSSLTTAGSVGQQVASVSTTTIASSVWNSSVRSLTDYASSTIATAIWTSPARTLTSFGSLVSDITSSVWSNSSRTLTAFGSLAGDVWNNTFAPSRQLTDQTLTNGGSLATQTDINNASSTIMAATLNNTTLINNLHNIQAADVWAYGSRSITGGSVDLTTTSTQAVWNVAKSSLTSSGSIGKTLADNIDATISSRGTSNITAADVWTSATRSLTDYSTSTLATAVWSNAARTLTSYGNDITAADVWNTLNSSLTTTGSIGKQLTDNIDTSISSRASQASLNQASSTILSAVLNNTTLINNLHNIQAADVWAYGTRSLTGSVGTVDLSASSTKAIWDVAKSSLTTSGSVGKQIADNLDATISSRGTSNLTAADVWLAATRTLTDYSTSSVATAVWSNAARTLTNYGNDITAADVWNTLNSTLTTTGSIGAQMASLSTSTIASSVWNSPTRNLTDYATSTIATAIWTSPARTLTSFGSLVSDITNSVWSNSSRTLTAFGSLAGDVWNNTFAPNRELTDQNLSSGGKLATQTDVINASSSIITEVLANRTLINNLNNISANDVWAYGARTLTSGGSGGAVDLTATSTKAIWDYAKSNLTTSGSIGKLLADNLDAQISTRGTSNLTAADVWNSSIRSLTDYSTSSLATAVWANAARTLTSYGNDITAQQVWDVLSTSLTTTGSIGKQLSTNVDTSLSSIKTEVLTNRSLINSLNNISAADVWAYGSRSVNGDVNISTTSQQNILNTAVSGLNTNGSVGKLIANNLDAQISTRGTSNLTAADVWNSSVRSLTDNSSSTIATAVWANASRTLTNYGNNITAADVWNVLSSSLTTVGTIGNTLNTNIDTSLSSIKTEVLTNRTLINSLNNVSAADVWAYGARTLTSGGSSGAVDLTATSTKAIWDYAKTNLTTTGSVGKLLADNLDAQVSSRGTSNLTAADVWNTSVRTLSDYSTSTIASAVWANAARTLTSYGNNISAADVWNVLSSSLTTVGSIGNQLSTNIDATITSRASAVVVTGGWTVQMTNTDRQQVGKVYRTKVIIYNSSNAPAVPYQTPTIDLYDANRNLVASAIPMTLISTGVYEYTYTIAANAAQGLWETVANTQVENGKTITTNDYWEVASSPAQVLINNVSGTTVPNISANITITNEGLTGYEYQYEWCVVADASNACGGGDDIFHATAAKFINPGEDFNTNLTATVPNAGNYLFKLVVYFGTQQSRASRTFAAQTGNSNSGGSGGGGGGSGGGNYTTPQPTGTEGQYLSADLNKEGNVDSVDFSILLSFWHTKPPYKNPRADINKDGKVDSIDFSIMLYQWKRKK